MGGVGEVLGKFSGHDDVGLAGFFIEEFPYRRDQKVKKGLGGINMVEVHNNRVWLIDGGCEL